MAKTLKPFVSAIAKVESMLWKMRNMRYLTCFHLLSMPYMFPGSLNLRTRCPSSLPSLIWSVTSSPILSLLNYTSQSVVLDLGPWTIYPKRNTRTSSIVLYFLSLLGMFVSPPSSHLQQGHMLQVLLTFSFQKWNGGSRSLEKVFSRRNIDLGLLRVAYMEPGWLRVLWLITFFSTVAQRFQGRNVQVLIFPFWLTPVLIISKTCVPGWVSKG